MSNQISTHDVNQELGDSMSRHAYNVQRATWRNSPYVEVYDLTRGHFRGPRHFRYKNLPADIRFHTGADGIGTKVFLSIKALKPREAARNGVAMVRGDFTRWGQLCLLVSNVLDVRELGLPGTEVNNFFRELLAGLGDAAKAEEFLLYNGETAEMSEFVGSEDPDGLIRFNWAFFGLGVSRDENLITGENLRPGLVIIALHDPSGRSNGYTAIRKAFRLKFGRQWWAQPEAKPFIDEAAAPSALYDRFLARMNGWYNPEGNFKPLVPVVALSHISGGGIPTKFGEDLLYPRDLSAELTDLWNPPNFIRNCYQWLQQGGEKFDLYDAYKKWGNGQGKLVVVEERHADVFLSQAHRAGIGARRCGKVVRSEGRPRLLITSKFGGKEVLEFPHP